MAGLLMSTGAHLNRVLMYPITSCAWMSFDIDVKPTMLQEVSRTGRHAHTSVIP